jgi:hypothetical protein
MNIKQGAGSVLAIAAVATAGWFLYPLVAEPEPPPPFFADWGAVIVAGDWRAANGRPSDVFDNGRRELAKKFISVGFRPENVLQYSVFPQNYPHEQNLLPSAAEEITAGLQTLSTAAPGGCMVYFTSHGTEKGIIIGDRLVDPQPIADRIGEACGDRPTVVIVSACFAGQFIGPLRGPNRIVLTAARPDRSSFGCGEQDEYTFFDACVLQEFDRAANFSELASFVDVCVKKRETELKVDPPSEPQFWLGANVAYTLNWR